MIRVEVGLHCHELHRIRNHQRRHHYKDGTHLPRVQSRSKHLHAIAPDDQAHNTDGTGDHHTNDDTVVVLIHRTRPEHWQDEECCPDRRHHTNQDALSHNALCPNTPHKQSEQHHRCCNLRQRNQERLRSSSTVGWITWVNDRSCSDHSSSDVGHNGDPGCYPLHTRSARISHVANHHNCDQKDQGRTQQRHRFIGTNRYSRSNDQHYRSAKAMSHRVKHHARSERCKCIRKVVLPYRKQARRQIGGTPEGQAHPSEHRTAMEPQRSKPRCNRGQNVSG